MFEAFCCLSPECPEEILLDTGASDEEEVACGMCGEIFTAGEVREIGAPLDVL